MKLAEISLQQTGESLAVAGLVAGHLVDGMQNTPLQGVYLQEESGSF